MRSCLKCGDFHADRLLAFCPADGTPLTDVNPGSNTWSEGVRAIEQKRDTLRTNQRRLKWRRVMSRAMLTATMVVTVASVTRSISVTVDKPQGELCIRTFNDLNGNGVQDTGELIVPDFHFQVSGEATPATTLTMGPNAGCENFPVGTYTVVEQPQGGWTATTPTTQTVTITARQSANVLFGSKQDRPPNTGKLCISAFNDQNGNNKQDAGEPSGLSGFVFQVSEASGTGAATTITTGPNGGCEDLPAGTYTVVEQPQHGWIATTPATQTVTVIASQQANVLFGSRQQTELCVSKFEDLNSNGVQDAGEAGVSGFVFQVSGTGPATTLTTGPNGVGCLVVPVGTYTVVEPPQSGWIATTRTTQTVAATAGQPANLSFGRRQATGKLCLKTFDDRNGNHVQDAGEPGLSGFVFQVSGTGATTGLTTDSQGGACSDLPVGTYTVVEQMQGGWIATTPTTQTVTVTASKSTNVPFGSKQESGKLCIRTFDDQNGNGVQDAGEPARSEVAFQVRATGPETKLTTLTTDLKGDVCSPLAAGRYTIVETPKPGWIATTSTKQTVTVNAGQATSISFGSRQPKVKSEQERGKLCIRAFDDQNANRVQDAEEPVLSGFVFQVVGTDPGSTINTELKDGNCSELPVGRYTVIEIPKPGWISTTPPRQTVTIAAGQSTNKSFGSRQERIKSEAGRLCIRVFNDLNSNRVQDAGEAPLSGFVFQVRGTAGATTLRPDLSPGGCSVLPVGVYTVIQISKPGWVATTATTQPVSITANQASNLSFGNRANQECSDAEKSLQIQIIMHQYKDAWRRLIEGERNRIIAENVPAGAKNVEATLGPIKDQIPFATCTAVTVVLRYEWLLQSASLRKTVPGGRKFNCAKMGGAWVCR